MLFSAKVFTGWVKSHVPSLEDLPADSQRLPRQRDDHLGCHSIQSRCLASEHRSSRLQKMCHVEPQRSPSSFAAREADSTLHNSIFDSPSMLSDSNLTLAYRQSSSVQCSRSTVRPTPSQRNIPVNFVVCPFVSFFARPFLRCGILKCFRTSDRAFLFLQRFGPLPSWHVLGLDVFF